VRNDRVVRALLCAFAGILQISCAGSVKLPNSDSTPPSADLTVEVEGFKTFVNTQSQPVTHHFSKFPVELTGHGYDGDGGIKRVSIQGSEHWTCVQPNGSLFQTKDGLFSSDSPFSFTPKPGDKVLKELFHSAEMTLNEFSCQPAYVLSGGEH
jgi:hypothetical protein